MISRFASRIVRFLGKLACQEWSCWHRWKIDGVEDVGEDCRYLMRVKCRKCGATGRYYQ